MKKIPFGLVALVAVLAASPALAGELKLSIANGRATLIAQDVPAAQILSEWTRLGGTRIVNAEKLTGPAISAQLVDRPEREVLDFVLRAASGYVAAPRADFAANQSMYDRVVILATSVAPAFSASSQQSAPTFTRPPTPMPIDDDLEQPPMPPQGLPPGMPVPQGMNPGTQVMPAPGMPMNQPMAAPGMPNPAMNPNQPMVMPVPGAPNQPLTAPRPGMLPQPQQPTMPNPFTPPPRPPTGRGGGPGLPPDDIR